MYVCACLCTCVPVCVRVCLFVYVCYVFAGDVICPYMVIHM